jgi:hypothetical protein
MHLKAASVGSRPHLLLVCAWASSHPTFSSRTSVVGAFVTKLGIRNHGKLRGTSGPSSDVMVELTKSSSASSTMPTRIVELPEAPQLEQDQATSSLLTQAGFAKAFGHVLVVGLAAVFGARNPSLGKSGREAFASVQRSPRLLCPVEMAENSRQYQMGARVHGIVCDPPPRPSLRRDIVAIDQVGARD